MVILGGMLSPWLKDGAQDALHRALQQKASAEDTAERDLRSFSQPELSCSFDSSNWCIPVRRPSRLRLIRRIERQRTTLLLASDDHHSVTALLSRDALKAFTTGVGHSFTFCPGQVLTVNQCQFKVTSFGSPEDQLTLVVDDFGVLGDHSTPRPSHCPELRAQGEIGELIALLSDPGDAMSLSDDGDDNLALQDQLITQAPRPFPIETTQCSQPKQADIRVDGSLNLAPPVRMQAPQRLIHSSEVINAAGRTTATHSQVNNVLNILARDSDLSKSERRTDKSKLQSSSTPGPIVAEKQDLLPRYDVDVSQRALLNLDNSWHYAPANSRQASEMLPSDILEEFKQGYYRGYLRPAPSESQFIPRAPARSIPTSDKSQRTSGEELQQGYDTQSRRLSGASERSDELIPWTQSQQDGRIADPGDPRDEHWRPVDSSNPQVAPNAELQPQSGQLASSHQPLSPKIPQNESSSDEELDEAVPFTFSDQNDLVERGEYHHIKTEISSPNRAPRTETIQNLIPGTELPQRDPLQDVAASPLLPIQTEPRSPSLPLEKRALRNVDLYTPQPNKRPRIEGLAPSESKQPVLRSAQPSPATSIHVDSPQHGTDMDIFVAFVKAYQDYDGGRRHFQEMCTEISELGKNLHKSLWDDYVVRNLADYDDSSEMTYKDFYDDRIDEPLHTNRILNPSNLKLVLEDSRNRRSSRVSIIKDEAVPDTSRMSSAHLAQAEPGGACPDLAPPMRKNVLPPSERSSQPSPPQARLLQKKARSLPWPSTNAISDKANTPQILAQEAHQIHHIEQSPITVESNISSSNKTQLKVKEDTSSASRIPSNAPTSSAVTADKPFSSDERRRMTVNTQAQSSTAESNLMWNTSAQQTSQSQPQSSEESKQNRATAMGIIRQSQQSPWHGSNPPLNGPWSLSERIRQPAAAQQPPCSPSRMAQPGLQERTSKLSQASDPSQPSSGLGLSNLPVDQGSDRLANQHRLDETQGWTGRLHLTSHPLEPSLASPLPRMPAKRLTQVNQQLSASSHVHPVKSASLPPQTPLHQMNDKPRPASTSNGVRLSHSSPIYPPARARVSPPSRTPTRQQASMSLKTDSPALRPANVPSQQTPQQTQTPLATKPPSPPPHRSKTHPSPPNKPQPTSLSAQTLGHTPPLPTHRQMPRIRRTSCTSTGPVSHPQDLATAAQQTSDPTKTSTVPAGVTASDPSTALAQSKVTRLGHARPSPYVQNAAVLALPHEDRGPPGSSAGIENHVPPHQGALPSHSTDSAKEKERASVAGAGSAAKNGELSATRRALGRSQRDDTGWEDEAPQTPLKKRLRENTVGAFAERTKKLSQESGGKRSDEDGGRATAMGDQQPEPEKAIKQDEEMEGVKGSLTDFQNFANVWGRLKGKVQGNAFAAKVVGKKGKGVRVRGSREIGHRKQESREREVDVLTWEL